MCGRYALIKDSELASRYDKPIIGGYAVNPRYNVAPSQYAPVITPLGIEVMRWGLIPSWAKDIKIRLLNDKYAQRGPLGTPSVQRPGQSPPLPCASQWLL